VTKSKKSETRTLERKPSVSMKELLRNVSLGDKTEDTLTSLASRLVRLNSQMTPTERKEFADTVGVSAGKLAEDLLNAFDEDVILQQARETYQTPEPTEEQMKATQKAMATEAVAPLQIPEAREHIENVRRSHDQIIDNVNTDTVLFAGFDAHQKENVERAIATFREFIDENRDEIIALRIIYSEAYRDRPMVLEKLKALYEKLKAKYLTVERLWDCYTIRKPEHRISQMAVIDGKLYDFSVGWDRVCIPLPDINEARMYVRSVLTYEHGRRTLTDQEMAEYYIPSHWQEK
jgi:type I restriction enzyme R subunit